ncbi:hypothetical protein D9599_22635 [Roseomonas sp. KE2513]|uniref:hypothetical protein n=1 Tax=Roseomonas sp. KE2513 TaxID=2479202 RepID=UPI0018E0237A|nr:hypothetical protein [Roseomonas sp. KE2513]MBI0538365.1 hypothetical protein [Roseomonas sp. KE2513]
MHDEEGGGISGGAGYVLGRMSVQAEQARSRMLTAFLDRRRPAAGPMYAEAEVLANIEEWRASVRSKERTIEQLRAHGTSLAIERDQLLARVADLEAHTAERQTELASLERAERGANAMLRDRTDELEALELAFARMSAQMADLQRENERLRRGGN